ncbi:MAG: urea ABC transporter substrate-binding protein, partial [Gammaproteobacteria bacterium]
MAFTGWHFGSQISLGGEPIRVGILHSLTGTMAISETSVAEATVMAIEEINQQGGLLGRKIEPRVVDGRSDWPTFAKEAERLITEENVSAIFGCWTSACRKTVKRVVEKYNHLLLYPVQYEGLEQSPYIVYTGAAANQQLIPAVKWCFDHLGRKLFLIGSDYVFPRTANAIIKDHIAALKGKVLGEEYILLGSGDVKGVVRKIAQTRPDVILNTINGDTNVAFFKELRTAGITPKEIPTMSFSIAEDELRILGAAEMAGDYASWNYFQSIAG